MSCSDSDFEPMRRTSKKRQRELSSDDESLRQGRSINKSGEPRKQREPRAKLMKWTDGDWKMAILAVVYACGEEGVHIPFDKAAKTLDGHVSGSAFQQALLKLKAKMADEGREVPPLKMAWSKKDKDKQAKTSLVDGCASSKIKKLGSSGEVQYRYRKEPRKPTNDHETQTSIKKLKVDFKHVPAVPSPKVEPKVQPTIKDEDADDEADNPNYSASYNQSSFRRSGRPHEAVSDTEGSRYSTVYDSSGNVQPAHLSVHAQIRAELAANVVEQPQQQISPYFNGIFNPNWSAEDRNLAARQEYEQQLAGTNNQRDLDGMEGIVTIGGLPIAINSNQKEVEAPNTPPYYGSHVPGTLNAPTHGYAYNFEHPLAGTMACYSPDVMNSFTSSMVNNFNSSFGSDNSQQGVKQQSLAHSGSTGNNSGNSLIHFGDHRGFDSDLNNSLNYSSPNDVSWMGQWIYDGPVDGVDWNVDENGNILDNAGNVFPKAEN